MKLQGKTVWVTGASSGIGEALAVELAGRGARLVLTARRASELERVRQRCPSPERHHVFPLDLSDADALEPHVQRLLAEHGPVDVLLHCSGLSQRSRTVETSMEVDRRLMELNYFAAVALTKALLPSMLERGGGQLAVISSVAGKLGVAQRSAYCGSKFALHGFFEAVRAELHHRGIEVTLICPGYVRTQIAVNALSGDGQPFGRTDDNIAGGISAEACAKVAARGIERGEEEVVVGGSETYGILVKRVWPKLASYLVRRVAHRES